MKKLSAFLVAVVLVIAGIPLVPSVVRAETANGVHYQKATVNETTHVVTFEDASHDCTVVWGGITNWGTAGRETWYVVNSPEEDGLTINSPRITVNGIVNLILSDGCKLTAKMGITVSEGNTLNIYGQSGGTGTLYAGTTNGEDKYDPSNCAGIGGEYRGDGGTITINGGTVTAKGDDNCAGIGGGYQGNGGKITINGGTVKVKDASGSAGIGGGHHGNGGDITINGGIVTATANSGAGIGNGPSGTGGKITINGGTVNAISTGGAGIGGGIDGAVDTITITGGEVNATGTSSGAGIGGGNGGAGGTITITGGNVTATGTSSGAGIGGGYNGAGGTITINGGNVTAKGGTNGAGIGRGNLGAGTSDNGSITISNGVVKATGGHSAAGIGGGYTGAGAGQNSVITISGGYVQAVGGEGNEHGTGAGIGGGAQGNGANVTINGGIVYAIHGAQLYPGIGRGSAGNSNNDGDLTIGPGVEGYTSEAKITTVASSVYGFPEHKMRYILAGKMHTHTIGSVTMTFVPWFSADSLPGDGEYFLVDDVELNSTWNSTANLNLCLNGHRIRYTGNSNTSVLSVADGKSLSIHDCGTTEHKYTVNEGTGLAVVDDTATGADVKTFTGGYITGGKDSGVKVDAGGLFSMYAGTIIGNTTTGNGGGVYVGGTFSISGNPTIIGNTANGHEENVYLPADKKIEIQFPLENSALIGVTKEDINDTTRVFTDGLSGKGTADNFISDNPNFGVRLTDAREAELTNVLATYKVTFKVKNGKWADGTTKGKVVRVYDFDNDTVNGAFLAITQIPAVGNPDSGYIEGRWDTEPDTTTAIMEDAKTYTYTFIKNAGGGGGGGQGGGGSVTPTPTPKTETDKDSPAYGKEIVGDPVIVKDGDKTTTTTTYADGSTGVRVEETTSDGTKIFDETITAKDGSTESKRIEESTDGSKVTTDAKSDPTGANTESTTVKTNKDGKVVETSTESKTTAADGTVTIKSSVINTEGTNEYEKVTKPNGDFAESTVKKDASGKLVESVVESRTTDEEAGTVTIKSSVTNAEGTEEYEKVTKSNGDFAESTVKKDAEGNIIETIDKSKTTSETGAVTEIEEITTADGVTTTITLTQPNGDMSTVTIKKDSEGTIIETVGHSKETLEDGSVQIKDTHFTEDTSTTKTTITRPDGSSVEIDTVIDADDITTETTFEKDKDGKVTGVCAEERDSNGNGVKETFSVDEDGSLILTTAETTGDTLIIPDSVTDRQGKTYPITTLAKGSIPAVETVYIGENVTLIENGAFMDSGVKVIRFDGPVQKGMLKKNSLKGAGGKKGKGLTIEVQSKKDKKIMNKQKKNAGVKKAKVVVVK